MYNKELKGFSYFVSLSDLKEYMKVPYKWRLEWLEQANEFTKKALTPKKLKIWQKFRNGEI